MLINRGEILGVVPRAARAAAAITTAPTIRVYVTSGSASCPTLNPKGGSDHLPWRNAYEPARCKVVGYSSVAPKSCQ